MYSIRAATLFLTIVLLFSRSLAFQVWNVALTEDDTFEPDTVNAKPGDAVVFTWKAGTHSVTQQSALRDCTPPKQGVFFDSTVMRTPASSTNFTLTFNYIVPNNTDKVFVYCRVHCNGGMEMTINTKSGGAANDYRKSLKAAHMIEEYVADRILEVIGEDLL